MDKTVSIGIGSLLSYYIIMFREIKMKNQEEFLDKTEKGGNENDIRDKEEENATKIDEVFTDQQKVKLKYKIRRYYMNPP